MFLEALRKDVTQRAAARQLHEIEIISASWIRVSPAIWHDDQPLDRAGVVIEAGWFAAPLLSVTVRSQPERFSTDVGRTFWGMKWRSRISRPRRASRRCWPPERFDVRAAG